MDLHICKGCGFEATGWNGTCEKCGGHAAVSVLRNAVDANLGRVVAERYKLLARLGEGGMGTVYVAEQLGVGNKVAVKFLRGELSSNAELARRFLHEARTVIRVAHPNAVQLHDFGRDEATGDLFISMELVEGTDLRKLLDQDLRLPLAVACEVALQIADVLAHAHSRGVVHRDLKPENVMVRRGLSGLHVKLLDFGIARLVYEGAARLTQAGAVAGTPRYMSPEQMRGEDVDARSDIYALGVLFFEMLSGTPAIDGGLVPEVLAGLPPTVDAFIARACAKSRDARYPTMSEAAVALAAIAGRAPQLSPPTMSDAAIALAATGQAPQLSPPTSDPTTGNRDPQLPDAAIALQQPPTTMSGPTIPGRAAQPQPPAAASDPPLPPPTRATDFPRTAPPPPASPRPRVALVAAALLLAGAGGAALLSMRTPAPVVPAPSMCPGLDFFDERLRALSISELEQQVASLPYMMPSMAKNQLRTLQASMQTFAADKRACMYRVSLIGSVASIPTVFASSPALFGHTSTSAQLRSWFLELPLREPWTPQQRASVLEQIDTLFLPNLKVEGPGDDEFWKRQYYGIELTCEASDATLEKLKTRRTTDCLNLKPR